MDPAIPQTPPVVGRPLILARPVQITPSGSINVTQDENVLLVRTDSGHIHVS